MRTERETSKYLSLILRHRPIVYQVDAKKMQEDDYDFFLSVNGVWLTKNVPPEYLTNKIF